jgi:hypothetical protein
MSFAMMYMFIHYIYTKYINAHIHQGLNLRPHASMPRSYPPKHFKTLLTKKKLILKIMFGWSCLGNSNFIIFFPNFIQLLQMKTQS